jgi:hypothetical protein
MVVPGVYEAHLTIDGTTHVESFNVLMDPRSEIDGITLEDIQAQYDLGIQVRAAIEDADATIDRLSGAMERASKGGDVEKQLKEIEDALVTDRSITSYPQPMLRDQFQYLYGNSIGVDQRPAVDMYDRLDFLKAELEEHKQKLETLMRSVTE